MERIRLIYRTFFIIGFIASAGSAAGTPYSFERSQIDRVLQGSALTVSKDETRLANNLAKVYEITDKGYINIDLTKKVLKQARNFSAFHAYKDWLKSIIDINSQKTAKSMRKTCDTLVDSKAESNLQSNLLGKSVIMCFNQYLKLMAKKYKAPIGEHADEIAFFKKRAGYISHPSNIESLSFFLSRYDRESPLWKQYSKAVAAHMMEENLFPSKTLLQYMEITPELTRYIQVRGFEEAGSKYVLYSELKKLIKKAFEAANDEKSPDRVRKPLKEAINYYTLSYPHLPQAKSDTNMLSLGKSLVRRSYFASARETFEAIERLNPKDENTIFEIMWTWLTQGDYKKAYKNVVVKYGLDKNYRELEDDRLQFWTAFTLKEIGKDKNKEIFEDLISKSALNYYSILSSKLLNEHRKEPRQTEEKMYFKLANKNNLGQQKLPPLESRSLLAIKRLKIWGAMDFKPLLNLERANIFHSNGRSAADDSSALGKTKSALMLLSASALKQEENYLESFKLIYKGLRDRTIALDETVLNILFPKPYLPQVADQIKSFDPLIALSLIRQESGFNRKARSWVGARGLMQLMPATAKMYWRGIKTNHLYNPNINIKIGSKYLSMLLEKYDHNLVYALSAYNAGESRVKKWRKEYLNPTNSILHNIENIPFPETRKYVKLIFRNLFFYKMLDNQIEIADSDKVNEIFDIQLGFNDTDALEKSGLKETFESID